MRPLSANYICIDIKLPIKYLYVCARNRMVGHCSPFFSRTRNCMNVCTMIVAGPTSVSYVSAPSVCPLPVKDILIVCNLRHLVMVERLKLQFSFYLVAAGSETVLKCLITTLMPFYYPPLTMLRK